MNIPEDLRYTASHEWVRREADGTLSIGITDHAQDSLGELVFVEMPEPGRRLAEGDACAVVESVKAASDVYAPVAGEVVARNDALAEAPAEVNKDPYAAWLFRIKPDREAALDNLMDAGAYRGSFGTT
jgi:glycine cleavage system H protein